MRMRSFVSSAALVGSLLASSALVNTALAQKGTFMSPSTSWAVSKVDNQANPYCALAKKFNQGTVLTVARNSSSETSMALDFQQPVFSSGQDVKIMLDPGAGQQRAYTIKPVSNKAFVVRMGRDPSFFGAMERTGLLRIEVAEKSFHFNVSDIDTGQSQLDACIASAVMPAAGDESPVVSAGAGSTISSADLEARVADATKSFRSEINNLRKQINTLKERNTALQTQLKSSGEGVSEVSSSVTQLSAELRKLEDENVLLKRRLAEAQTTAVVEPDTESLSEISKLQAELEQIRREKLTLEAKLQSGESDSEQILVLMDQVKELKSANRQLEAAIASPVSSGVDDAAVAELESQVSALEDENERLSSDILTMRENIKNNYESQLAALERENVSLKDAQKAMQSQQAAQNVDGQLLDQLREQIAKTENENRLLKETASQASASMQQELQSKHQKEIAELKSAAAQDIVALEKEIENLLSAQDAKDSEIAAMDKQLDTIEKLRGENKVLQDELAASMANVNELKADKKKALEQVSAVAETQSETHALSSQKIADLHEHVTELENTNTSLKKSLDEVKAELASALSLNEELRADLSAKETLIASLGDTEKALATAQTENVDLRKQSENLQAQAEKAQASLDSKEQELAALQVQSQKDLEAKREQIAALKAENESALQAKDEQIAKLKSDFAQQQDASGSMDAEYSQQLAKLEEQKAQLKTSLEEVITLAETLKADNEKKDNQIASLMGEKEQLVAQNSDLQQRIEEQAEKIRVAAKAPEDDAEEEKRNEPVRSVVLGDVGATTAMQAQQPEPEEQSIAQQPAQAAAEPAPKEQPKVAKVVPIPSVKPSVPATALKAAETEVAMAEPAGQDLAPVTDVAELNEQPAASSAVESIRKIDAAMAVLEEEMQNTTKDEKERMEQLARQYAYLGVQRDYLLEQSGEAENLQELASVEALEAPQAEPESEQVLSQEPIQDQRVYAARDIEQDLSGASSINEAQQYEASLKAEQNVVDVVEQVEQPRELPQFEQEVEQPVTISQSADPFADMKVESQEGEVFAEAPVQEPISQVELQTPQQPVQPATELSFEQAVHEPAATVPIAGNVSIEELVTAARVSTPERIQRVSKASKSYDVAYQWNGGSIYGSAEQRSLPSPSQFDTLVQDYLERTQSRCPGEFAIVPDGSVGGGQLRADSYEVACVGSEVSSGASLLFFSQGGTFTVVAHEAPAEKLDSAISARNQVRRVVVGG